MATVHHTIRERLATVVLGIGTHSPPIPQDDPRLGSTQSLCCPSRAVLLLNGYGFRGAAERDAGVRRRVSDNRQDSNPPRLARAPRGGLRGLGPQSIRPHLQAAPSVELPCRVPLRPGTPPSTPIASRSLIVCLRGAAVFRVSRVPVDSLATRPESTPSKPQPPSSTSPRRSPGTPDRRRSTKP